MGAFLNKLKQMSASSGRVIDEQGARQNWADLPVGEPVTVAAISRQGTASVYSGLRMAELR